MPKYKMINVEGGSAPSLGGSAGVYYTTAPPLIPQVLRIDGEVVVDSATPIVRAIDDLVTNHWEWTATIGDASTIKRNTVIRDWTVAWDGNPAVFSWTRQRNKITMVCDDVFTQPQQIDVSVYADNVLYEGSLVLDVALPYYAPA